MAAEERERRGGRTHREGGERRSPRAGRRSSGGPKRTERPAADESGDAAVITHMDSAAAAPGAGPGPVEPGTVEGVVDASPALSQALLAVAEDAADEQTEDDKSGEWAALLRDGDEIARSVADPDVIAEVAPMAGEVEPEEWERLRGAAGAVVIKDARGRVSARVFSSSDDLWAEWTRLLAEVDPDQPGPGTTVNPESDDNPA
jgi:hypothetical protein